MDVFNTIPFSLQNQGKLLGTDGGDLEITVHLDLMCYMVVIYRRFGGSTCLHLQHKINRPGKTVQENVTAAPEIGDEPTEVVGP
jgi:hypothetical protein